MACFLVIRTINLICPQVSDFQTAEVNGDVGYREDEEQQVRNMKNITTCKINFEEKYTNTVKPGDNPLCIATPCQQLPQFGIPLTDFLQ